MFETFNTPALNISNDVSLFLCGSSGSTTGIVVDCGESVAHCVPIHDGEIVELAIERIGVSGRNLTDYLKRLIVAEQPALHFTTTAEHEIVRDIKEKLCYVAPDYDEYGTDYYQVQSYQVPYELPDGQVINIRSNLLFRCAEALFRPDDPIFLNPFKKPIGIHQAIYTSIMNCDPEIHEKLFATSSSVVAPACFLDLPTTY